MHPPQAENCTFGSPPVQSDKLWQTFTPLDRLILRGEKRNLNIVRRYRQVPWQFPVQQDVSTKAFIVYLWLKH